MADGLGKQFKSTGKQAAKQIARQIAHEPLEMMGVGKRQILGVEATPKENKKTQNGQSGSKEVVTPEEEAKKTHKSVQLMRAYEKEMADIVSKKKEEEILKANEQPRTQEGLTEEKPLIEPTVKPKRGLLSGIKTKIERLKRRSEIRMPPSG